MSRVYDLVMTHKLDADDFFIHRVQQHCAEAGWSFFLIEPLWAQAFYDSFRRGEVWARVLLNMHSEHHDPNDLYHRLVRLAAERHTKVIDPPAVALAAFNKAALHHRLIAAGIHVPYTLIVRREQVPEYRFVNGEFELLGTPFVIKPSLGYGRKGVVLKATSEADLVRSALAWPSDAYLLQRLIVPRDLRGEPAYWRVFYVFGSIWICWWNCHTDRYRSLAAGDLTVEESARLEDIARRIASTTGMKFFSTEVAQVESGGLIVIDYVNDQCHLLSQQSNPRLGVPDELVAAVAKRLVEGAKELVSSAP
ncbi:MAG: hypothetical protein HZA90_03290 [Verrucomicrobia bacterium]|nr:hypothetical protein [Verrucomicrobiota bacterium]